MILRFLCSQFQFNFRKPGQYFILVSQNISLGHSYVLNACALVEGLFRPRTLNQIVYDFFITRHDLFSMNKKVRKNDTNFNIAQLAINQTKNEVVEENS